MNEREFIRRLKSKINKNGDFTYYFVNELIESKSIKKKDKFIDKLLKRFRKTKSAKEIINDNIELIFESVSEDYLEPLVDFFLDGKKEYKDCVTQNVGVVLNKTLDVEFLNTIVLEYLLKQDETIKYIKENIQEILDKSKPKFLFKLCDKLRGISDQTDEIINSNLEQNKEMIAEELLQDAVSHNEQYDKQIKKYAPTLAIMIDELIRSENIRYIDLKYLTLGGFSRIFQVGEKILKIGKPRETYKIPNHPRILQPLTRINFLVDEDDPDKAFACIEISNKVDMVVQDDKSKEKLYQIYKELRQAGIIWKDIKFSNIGVLRSDNIPTLGGDIIKAEKAWRILHGENSDKMIDETVDVSPNSVGFDRKNAGKPLSKGDWVILDTDFLFEENYESKCYSNYGDFDKNFEKRYREEQEQKIKEAFERRTSEPVKKHEKGENDERDI